MSCKNIWHARPGALLKCPHCNMTLSENTALRAVAEAQNLRGASRAPQPAPIQRDARVQVKLFRNIEPSAAIDEMNAWLTKMAGDGRINVVNSESQIWPAGMVTPPELMLIVYYMIR